MNYSRQREEVLDQLSGHKDHPTADVIFADLRDRDPNISLATVYRNLKLLAKNGTIQKLSFVSGADHFDPNAEKHVHFVCDRCGGVFDVPMPEADTLDEEAAWHVPGIVTGHDLVFHGICERCCEAGEAEGSAGDALG